MGRRLCANSWHQKKNNKKQLAWPESADQTRKKRSW